MAQIGLKWVGLGAFLLGFSSLASAVTLSGRVVGPTGAPVAVVDLDVENSATGTPLTTPGDNTNAQGVFSFSVPAGTYNIAFIPPAGARLADRKLLNVPVTKNTSLGDISLQRGFLLTGRVVGPQNVPVNDVDLDVENSVTGERVPTHADHTSTTGAFAFLVPQGTHDVLVLPNKTALRVAAVRIGAAVTGDTNLGTIQLKPGFLLSGRVTGPGGAGVGNVDVDVIDQATGELIPTVGDNTAPAGNFSVVVPSGTFTVEFEPPMALGLAHAELRNVVVSGNRSANAVLTATQVAAGIARSGRLARAGQPYRFSVMARNTTNAPQPIEVSLIREDPVSGARVTLLGPKTLTLPPRFGPRGPTLSLNIEASTPPALRNRPLHLVLEVVRPSSGAPLDVDSTQFTIR